METKYIVSFLIISFLFISCIDTKEQEAINKHIQSQKFKNLKYSPEIQALLTCLHTKSELTTTNLGYKVEFENDSIVDYFSIDFKLETTDLNHEYINKSDLLKRIAIDLKPYIESQKVFNRIALTLTQESKGGTISTSLEHSFQSKLTDLPNDSFFKYININDTISIIDHFYNGKKAIQGKLINEKPNGLWEYWYSNGQKMKEGYYSIGEKTGEWKKWDRNGNQI